MECFKCHSKNVVRNVRIMDRGHYSGDAGDLALVVEENPDALFFKGVHQIPLLAHVCGECGYAEFYVKDPAAFLEAVRKAPAVH
jgi:predicted nucleic-acid-binding Zn-ribbon protein